MRSDKIIIEPGRGNKNYWKDLWRYRELFYILSWRDIKVRYKQTILGAAWSVLRPLLTTIIFTVVFSKLVKLTAPNEIPYPLMVFAAILPWYFFSTSVQESSNSLIGSANLVTKVYFPRLIIPVSAMITTFVDFMISAVIMVFIFIYYRFLPPIQVFLIPFFLLIALSCTLGFGVLLTALNVKYRDFKHIVPFIVQVGFYITPIGYNSKIIPSAYKYIYGLNPMVGVIDGFRWCLLGDQMDIILLIESIFISVIVLISGIVYFRKFERTFADMI